MSDLEVIALEFGICEYTRGGGRYIGGVVALGLLYLSIVDDQEIELAVGKVVGRRDLVT